MPHERRRIEAYLPRLYAYAFSLLRDRSRAEDLVHDCAVKALGAREVPFDEPAYRAWLFRILRNRFIDGLRHDRRTAGIFEETDGTEETMEYWGGDERLIDRVNVRLAFDKLDERQREILALIDIAGLSYRETAEVLGIPDGTVMSRVARARRRLLEAVGGSNVRSLPGAGRGRKSAKNG